MGFVPGGEHNSGGYLCSYAARHKALNRYAQFETMSYKIPIFLSCPKPYCTSQRDFMLEICEYLESRGFIGRTLGVTDYDMEEPLTAIRRLMLECNGLITIALRRAFIEKGKGKPHSDIGDRSYSLDSKWLTSPYCQIEPAMAFQIGLPILVFREEGVIPEGCNSQYLI